jgi:predicted nucleic acid-binding protein
VAELTTRAKPDPRAPAWFRPTARPNRFLSVITVAEIEVGVAAAPDSVRQARYARATVGAAAAVLPLTSHASAVSTEGPRSPY